MTSNDLKTVALLGVLGVVGVTIYKAKKGIEDKIEAAGAAVKQTVEQIEAEAQSVLANSVVGPFERGQNYMDGIPPVVSSKAWLYSDYGYTGVDPATGLLVTAGEYYGSEIGRQYEASLPPAARPPATSINGAAFGIYPR